MKKCLLLIIILLFLCSCGKKDNIKDIEYKDYSDVSNVSIIDKKLGNDIDITSGYLMTYVTKKSGIWYMSNGYVKDVKLKDNYYVYTISDSMNSKNVLVGSISNDRDIIKKGSYIYFVSTIDLSNGKLKLTKISMDPIDYKSVTNIEFTSLYNNISSLLNTSFIINGYLVTKGEYYYLYDTKEDFNNNSNDYFKVNFDEEMLYTGNAKVKLKCNVNGISSLKNCILLDK